MADDELDLTEEEEDDTDHGASLAFMALVEERELISVASDDIPDIPETLQPRIGEYLLRNRYLTAEQLDYALSVQAERSREGKQQPLGKTLVELGLITRDELDRTILQQLLELQDALQSANRNLAQRVKERTSQLQDALDRLAELNQHKTNFIANVSHELRTPLSHLRGYMSLLGDGTLGDLTEDQARAVEVSSRAVDRLRELIEDLIRFAESARGEMRVSLANVDLRDDLLGVLEHHQHRAQQAEVRLIQRLPNPMPAVYVDAEKMIWVVNQLVDNAIKFNRPGGNVVLGGQIVDDQFRLMVGDTGIGIAEDRMHELFTPFHQLDGSSTRRQGGTGLGLSLARSIVRLHGTDLDVQSQVDRGSVFSILLPLARPTPEDRAW